MKRWFYGCIGAVAVGITGCGSGGGSATVAGGGGTRSVGVFVTDDVRAGYDKVWADVHKIEMTSATGAKVTLFSDPKGKTVDLRSLHDAQGSRFLFLSNQSVPAGTYTGMKVTIGSKMTLFATGSTVGKVVAVSPLIPVDASGNPQVTVNLPTPVVVDSNSAKVVVDFDLSKFDLSGNQVTPVVKKGDTAGVDNPTRHENEDIKGTVSGLSGSASTLQFTLNLPNGNPVIVATDSATTLFFQSGASNPALANGEKVEVRGLVDPATNTLKATEIKIEDAAQNEQQTSEAKGLSGDVSEATGTFSLTVSEAENFQPSNTKVSILTNASTIFRSDSGVKLTATDFFARLGTSAFVKAEGVYASASNTLTATAVKIRSAGTNGGEGGNNGGNGGNGGGGSSQGREAEVSGTVVSPDANAKTLQLNPVSKFEGFSFAGGTLNIATTDTTEFKGANGKESVADFFASLPVNAKVEIKGTVKDGVLTAKTIQLDN